jgi:hypothetical protein
MLLHKRAMQPLAPKRLADVKPCDTTTNLRRQRFCREAVPNMASGCGSRSRRLRRWRWIVRTALVHPELQMWVSGFMFAAAKSAFAAR